MKPIRIALLLLVGAVCLLAILWIVLPWFANITLGIGVALPFRSEFADRHPIITILTTLAAPPLLAVLLLLGLIRSRHAARALRR